MAEKIDLPDATPDIAQLPTAATFESVPEGASAVATAGVPPLRRSYIPALAVATFGIYLALLTPIIVSLSIKIEELVGQQAATATLPWVLTPGAIVALVTTPLAGRLSDRTRARWGMRRPWIVGGGALGIVGFLVLTFAPNVPLTALGWCLAELGFNATLATINASVADQVPVERRGGASGVAGVATPLAILLGSLLVALFTNDAGRFLAPALIGLVLVVAFAFVLRDRKHSGLREPFDIKALLGSFVFNPRSNPDFGWVWLSRFMFFFGYMGVASFMAYFLMSNLHVAPMNLGGTIFFLNLFLIGATIIASLVGGFVSDRIGRRKVLLVVSSGVMTVGLVVMAFSTTMGVLAFSQVLIGLGAGTFFAVDLALATQVLPNRADVAKDLGVLNIATNVPQVLGPILLVPVLSAGSAIGLGGYTAWYIVAGIATILGAIFITRVKSVR